MFRDVPECVMLVLLVSICLDVSLKKKKKINMHSYSKNKMIVIRNEPVVKAEQEASRSRASVSTQE